jgi:hypothetical protein
MEHSASPRSPARRKSRLQRSRFLRFGTSLALGALLSGCGGGGDDSSPSTAEGFWEGNSSTGFLVSLAVLETGETWGIYTSTSGALVGGLYGNTSSSESSLSGSGRDFNIPSRTVASGTYSGTLAPKSTMSVTTAPAGIRFTGAYRPAYDQPASLAAVAGTFNGPGVSGTSPVQNVSVRVSTSGAVTASMPGCTVTGTAKPRPSGKNIFDVSVTFTGSNCALGSGTATTGVAYYDVTARKLSVMAMNAAKSDGFIYVGRK